MTKSAKTYKHNEGTDNVDLVRNEQQRVVNNKLCIFFFCGFVCVMNWFMLVSHCPEVDAQ